MLEGSPCLIAPVRLRPLVHRRDLVDEVQVRVQSKVPPRYRELARDL